MAKCLSDQCLIFRVEHLEFDKLTGLYNITSDEMNKLNNLKVDCYNLEVYNIYLVYFGNYFGDFDLIIPDGF